MVWNPITKRMSKWVDMAALTRAYGPRSGECACSMSWGSLYYLSNFFSLPCSFSGQSNRYFSHLFYITFFYHYLCHMPRLTHIQLLHAIALKIEQLHSLAQRKLIVQMYATAIAVTFTFWKSLNCLLPSWRRLLALYFFIRLSAQFFPWSFERKFNSLSRLFMNALNDYFNNNTLFCLTLIPLQSKSLGNNVKWSCWIS